MEDVMWEVPGHAGLPLMFWSEESSSYKSIGNSIAERLEILSELQGILEIKMPFKIVTTLTNQPSVQDRT